MISICDDIGADGTMMDTDMLSKLRETWGVGVENPSWDGQSPV